MLWQTCVKQCHVSWIRGSAAPSLVLRQSGSQQLTLAITAKRWRFAILLRTNMSRSLCRSTG